jgi:DNA-binding SARP family transcriptional activator/tetratricopeptide (TPR) repeat protein
MGIVDLLRIGDGAAKRRRSASTAASTQRQSRRPGGYHVPVLSVRLLGGVAAERAGESIVLTPPVGRLLALLALRPGQRERDLLAGELWPNAAPAAARANLRTAVWALRKAIGADAVLASRTAVGLRADAVCVDALDYARRAADGDANAVDALARDDLLPGIRDPWADSARREHRRSLTQSLIALAERAERDGDHAAAAHWARRRCELDGLDESAHADLLRHLVASGDRAAAVIAGRGVVERLRDDLGVGPGPLLRAALAEVRGPSSAGPATPPRMRALYGRDADLRALTDEWTLARAGAGRVVVITGEAGIGKSRLVAELASRAGNAGARVALGAGLDVGGEAPLAMWQELVPHLARTLARLPEGVAWPAELSRLSPDVAAQLGPPRAPTPVASPELERLRIFDAVLSLVEWASSGRPVLLVTEDVHRADRASMQLCAHIGRRLRALPVLFILTRRDRPHRPDTDALVADVSGRGVPVAQLDLGPLAAVDVAAIARSVAGLPDDGVDRVVRAADGNPLLAVASAHALAAGGYSAPSGLRAIVRAALGPLPRPARDLAEALAVAGRGLNRMELAALGATGVDEMEESILDTGLVQRSGAGLRFRHALLAEAARADLDEDTARYQRLAFAIETAAVVPDRVAAEVARLLHQAGRIDLAGQRWRQAARAARAMGALPEAERFWAEAVRCDPTAVLPRLELAEIYGWLGRPDDFEREWGAIVAILPDNQQSFAWARRGMVLRTVVCNPNASLSAYRRASELLPAEAGIALRSDIVRGMAWGEAAAGDPVRAADLLDEAERLTPPVEDEMIAELANVRVMTLIRQGRFVDCDDVAEYGGAAALRAGRPVLAHTIWLHTACALTCVGDFEGALRAADHAVVATSGIPAIELPCLAGRAFILSRLGRHEEALRAARGQLALAERIDSPAWVALASHDTGLIALAAGEFSEAALLLGRALADNAAVSRTSAHLARAEALVRSGAVTEARAEVRSAALEPVRAGDQPWALVPRMARIQGQIALASGDQVEARHRLDEAVQAWLRHVPHDRGSEFMAAFVDLGRPPIAGLVEPRCELQRVVDERAALGEPAKVG